jgi:branched-chain amino acid transport system substrate-binding protein
MAGFKRGALSAAGCLLGLLMGCALHAVPARAQASSAGGKPLIIGFVFDKTGPLEAYMKQTHAGFMMGLDVATGGSMTVAGRKIVVVEKDSQGKPDVGKAQLESAYADDKADLAIVAASSGVTLSTLPIAEEYKRILIVEPAVADSITGAKWNPYVFRTARSSTQDAVSNALVLDKPGTSIATLAQDNAFGRDGIRAFKSALKVATVAHEEYLPPSTTDFTAGAQRIIARLKNAPGRKVLFIIWAGGNPFKIADQNLARHGIEIATGGNILAAMAAYKAFPGMEGATNYYYELPKNTMNDELVKRHFAQFNSPPDFFTAGGMAAASAVVTALKATNGDSKGDRLMAAMRGMAFDTPKGRMVFRKEDHQAMQSMYHFRIKVDPTVTWAIPELVRELTPELLPIPIQNKPTQTSR